MTRPFAIALLLLFSFAASLAAQSSQFDPPALSSPDAWSIVLIPDTQNYVKYARNQPALDLMAKWILENNEPLKVQAVLHVGDLVEHNALLNPDGLRGDQPGKAQWEAVARSMGNFDGKIPFIAATGNHDIGISNAENRKTEYMKYFPVDKNPLSQRMLKEVGFDEEGLPSLTNALYEFTSPDDRKFLVLVLEFAPRSAVLDWASQVVNQEAYRDHTVILLAHSYLNRHNQRTETESYPLADANYGQAIWERLVKPSKNIQLVLSGHIAAPDNKSAHTGFRTDTNAAGKKVHQMAFNAQALGGGWRGNGGDGWLRILEFRGPTVTVKTFSPLFAYSPSTQHLAWGTEAFETFRFELE